MRLDVHGAVPAHSIRYNKFSFFALPPVFGPGSLKRPSVWPFVCLPVWAQSITISCPLDPQQQTRYCRFAAVGPAGRRY